MAQYGLYFMYFHGENTTTRWAYSRDGVRWDVAADNVALRAADWGAAVIETSYARVYEHTIPRFANPGAWAAWKPSFPVAGAYKVMVR
jgi:hypothetical protein